MTGWTPIDGFSYWTLRAHWDLSGRGVDEPIPARRYASGPVGCGRFRAWDTGLGEDDWLCRLGWDGCHDHWMSMDWTSCSMPDAARATLRHIMAGGGTARLPLRAPVTILYDHQPAHGSPYPTIIMHATPGHPLETRTCDGRRLTDSQTRMLRLGAHLLASFLEADRMDGHVTHAPTAHMSIIDHDPHLAGLAARISHAAPVSGSGGVASIADRGM